MHRFCIAVGLTLCLLAAQAQATQEAKAQEAKAQETVDTLFQAARELREQNKPKQARDTYLQILALLDEDENLRIRAAIYNNLGALAANRGNLDQAEDYYNDSLETRKHLGDQRGAADTYHNLGNIARQRGDFTSATVWYRESLALRESLGDTAGLIHTYNALGYVSVARGVQSVTGKVSRYFYGFLASKDIFSGYKGTIATTYGNWDKAGNINDDLQEAHQFYEQALTLSDRLNDRLGRALSYGNLGNIAQIRSEWARAVAFYDRAISEYEAAEGLQSQLGLADAYNNLGNISVRRKDFGSAELHYDTALSLYESLEDKSGMARVYFGLAHLSYEEKSYLSAAWRFARLAWNAVF